MFKLLLAVFVLGQLIYWLGAGSEWTRKFVHTVSGLVVLLLPFVWGFSMALLTGILFTVILFIAERNNLISSLSIGRESLGLTLYPLGLTLAIMFAWKVPLAFQTAVLVLTISDTSAWFFGRGYKGEKTPKKIWVSVIFGVVTFAIWTVVGGVAGIISVNYILASLLFSAVLSAVEYKSYYGSDNLYIPLLASAFGITVF